METEEGEDGVAPWAGMAGEVGIVGGIGKEDELFGAGDGVEGAAGVGGRGARIEGAVEEEGGAAERGGEIDGVVGEAIEAEAPAAPEDEEFGGGKGGDAHGGETVADGAEHRVEDGFEDDAVGVDAEGVNGAEDGGGSHALAVEEQGGGGEFGAGEGDGGGDVFGLQPAEGGVGFGGAAGTAEVDEEDGGARFVDGAGFGEQAGFVGGIAVEKCDEGCAWAAVGVPGGEADAAGGRDGKDPRGWGERGGQAGIFGSGQDHAGKQDAEFCGGGEVFGLVGSGAGRGVDEHGAGVAEGEDVEGGEGGQKQKGGEGGGVEESDFHAR